MKIVFYLLLLFVFVYGEEDDCYCRIHHKKRIVNGSRTRKHSVPWIVSLAKTDNEHYCGGTVINKRLILTAGHCVARMAPEEIKVRAGFNLLEDITEDQTYQVQKIHMNGFKTTTLPGDIAILELSRDLQLQKRKIEKACFNLNKQKYPEETSALAALGYGHIKSSYIDPKTGEEIKSRNAHRLRHAMYEEKSGKCEDFLLCMTPIEDGDSICSGDGGGPLENTEKGFTSIDGITSHVVPIVKEGITYNCGGEAAFARLSYYSSWFKKTTGKNFCNINKKRGGGLLKKLF